MNNKLMYPAILLILILAGCSVRPALAAWSLAQEPVIRAAVNAVSATEISAILNELNGVRNAFSNPGTLALFENSITTRLAASGCTVKTEPVTIVDGDGQETIMNNLIGIQAGANPALAPVMVSAHWDSVPNTSGMDDNASGCAGVLEAARVLAPVNRERTIIYALFAFEENGMTGSYQYVKNGGVLPHCLLNFEMIAYTSSVQPDIPLQEFLKIPKQGNFIGLVSLDWCWNLGMDFLRSREHFVPELPVYFASLPANVDNTPLLNNALRSDHISFWHAGIPALFLSDLGNFRNPNYHLPDDNLASLDLNFCRNVIKTGVAWLCLQAGVIVL